MLIIDFSYGSVVQLCVARNRRRAFAKRYKGVAKVTSRRARKGFMLKFNPDAHWSAAFYRNLNYIQYTDGRHILNVNRDDASGFRLDTMTTHRLHRTPMVKGSEATTTYTDYVNKYKAVLRLLHIISARQKQRWSFVQVSLNRLVFFRKTQLSILRTWKCWKCFLY